MQIVYRIWQLSVCSVCLLVMPCGLANDSHFASRQWFIEAEQAQRVGDKQRYQQLSAKLLDYPLYPYLQYTELLKDLVRLPTMQVTFFLARYPNSVLAQQLYQRWLAELARQQQWALLLAFYQPDWEPSSKLAKVKLQCHVLQAHLALLPWAMSYWQHRQWIEQLWLTGYPQPSACDPVFDYWKEHNLLAIDDYWKRIKLAFLADQKRLVNHLQKKAPMSLKKDIAVWKTVYDKPNRLLSILKKQKKIIRDRNDLIALALVRLAKARTQQAINLYNKITSENITLTVEQQQRFYIALGISLARKSDWKSAAIWLAKVNPVYANKKVHQWRLRTGLALQDWQQLLMWLQAIPDTYRQQQSMWDYWHARTFQQLNKRHQANIIWYRLARQANYYGMLARQQLRMTPLPLYLIQTQSTVPMQIAQQASIKRAYELWQLRRYRAAWQEWQHSLSELTQAEQATAALLAKQWGWYYASILTTIRTDNQHNIALHAPLAYVDIVTRYATQHQLPLAWVFAVIRQESAYMSHANSHSGAIGLMQLLPSTANMVSKQHNIALPNHRHLLYPKTNIALGSAYLKQLWQQFDDWVLATIAYNAGPSRVAAWLKKQPNTVMPLDLFIEQLPWFETRNYIKNVIYFASVYQQQLGNKSTLLALPFTIQHGASEHDNTTHTP